MGVIPDSEGANDRADVRFGPRLNDNAGRRMAKKAAMPSSTAMGRYSIKICSINVPS
jgi:hypothetical protein